jgi:hypothetical protein
MGWFGKIASFAGGAVKKLGEVGREGLKKLGAIKSSYDNVNNAFGGAIANAITSIPVAGPILKGIGDFLKNKESIKTLENTLDHARVYGRDFQALGNRLERNR